VKRSEIEIKPAVDPCSGPFVIGLSVSAHKAELAQFNQYATLTVKTGAAHLQTYLSPDELRKLASNLLDAAVDLQKIINAQEVAA
jgi:hypothetical protein